MANTTYTSPILNTAPKRAAAYEALAILIDHIRYGSGGYTMDLLSVVFDQGTKIITLVLSNPLPAGQITRYNLAQV